MLLPLVCFVFLCSALPSVARKQSPSMEGFASYYNARFHGRCCTASGEKVNIYSMTAAHRTLPLGSVVRVTNLRNHKSVVVRINDRGPYGGGRIIDLSVSAFKKIALTHKGLIKVRLQVL
ncbi:septal ring lytic transglycosylase RlpA family lipoprotein [bacterium (Candidatus Blackallbacteria) CG17_big_fil_post_rev_8_21_14_2_50_48_46]|uniref:Probable endolytic peptidoglycan transglycosylase RlpA n=1 Tax=bacterium (Candidatus Blackallbacteria) CG17_big_fil_post_rev_8_21_14_2_50_48_46 TaxID=2014261 RepID=A0A2M7G6H0_9BACT|nr:MAG: septal ring lytic transglycosylase RlpA family lipoprotein [bacterium (Candidatus Blackallbacteria) CG18_big_fil_WC_8_21_14_2_50_49_26]PIW17611.1 MAG: septal ring lytic transglycosylase RlpA family lipoprotein [bacterium (Candidatus Blackallbacteria) CG17_big_fil_post_rev_8_21_14_2_50_48_46]PIW48466.1 MAG: septal ring lytic transglycosylase RlpA family lipoprotein [bacterium (Candidatus Blackallbacteria) CG13_big_fil_rev_8_21_14_2_50_49_14]